MKSRTNFNELDLLRRVQKVGALGFFIIDLVEQKWEVSEVLADILEFGQRQKDGLTSWLQYIHPEDQAKTMALFEETLRNGKHFQTSYRAKMEKSGKFIWLEVDAEVYYLEDGTPDKMIGTAKNINSYKELIEKLSTTASYLKEAQRVGKLGSFRVDFEAGSWEISPILAEILGADQLYFDQLNGWFNYIHPDDRKLYRQKFEAAVVAKATEFHHDPYRVINKKTGKIIWLDVSGEINYNQTGRATSLLGNSKDITELRVKQLELERKNKVLRSVAWQQSHGFRSPLSRALGILMEIEEGEPSEEELAFYLQNLRSSLEEVDGQVQEIVTKVNTLEADYLKPEFPESLGQYANRRNYIHIVDDDPVTLRLHQKIMSRIDPKAEIHLSQSGAELLERLRKPRKGSNLILLDINMPDMDGWEVLEKLENDFIFVNTEVVMVSSSADLVDQQKAFEHDLVLDYIVKPLGYDKIVKLVQT